MTADGDVDMEALEKQWYEDEIASGAHNLDGSWKENNLDWDAINKAGGIQ